MCGSDDPGGVRTPAGKTGRPGLPVKRDDGHQRGAARGPRTGDDRAAGARAVHRQLCRNNMNVAISTIAKDIGTTVIGMQTAITLFTLTMPLRLFSGR